MVLGDVEKEKFRSIMRKVEAFCGVRILTYSILSNHFHILLQVPPRKELTDEALLQRLSYLYNKEYVNEVRKQLKAYRAAGREKQAEELRQQYLYRMYDLSEFMKTLKQRFTQWFNWRNEREGTLWEARFKSVLVEFRPGALRTMAAYIDLNAVRAGLVEDPKDYRYCGYGEAVAGNRWSRMGLGVVLGEGAPGWRRVSAAYRQMLYARGEKSEQRHGISPQKVRQVLEDGGQLSRSELMQCRVRYLSDGVVLGSKTFVEEVFAKHRDQFGLKRKTGARPMKFGDWDGLCTMRDLRKQVLHSSAP
jgi:REP element-mobilizing transposase RayT